MSCAAVSMSLGEDDAADRAGIDRGEQEIHAQHAALRRVATLVARGVSREDLFAVVNRELARLVRADAAALLRYESQEKITMVAAWNAAARQCSWASGSR